MTVEHDYYRVLQVDPSAHPEVIRAACRTLLRGLGKHPDLGGDDGEARRILAAYEVLKDPERRRAYDLTREPTAAAPSPTIALPEGAAQWIRGALPDHRDAADAPFAAHFDLVLRPRWPPANLLYVKGAALAAPARWAEVFNLYRAVRLARSGLWPYLDAILLVVPEPPGVAAFLAEAARPKTRATFNRCVLAVCTYPPPRLHTTPTSPVPRSLRRLVAG